MPKDLELLIERLSNIPGLGDLAMTTNACGLKIRSSALRSAGLKPVTISCHSLECETFKSISKRDALPTVLVGIEATIASGFPPPKINCVVIRGMNDDEVADFADFAPATGVCVRFIEYMPLDNGHRWDRRMLVGGREVLQRIEERYELVLIDRNSPSETALKYAFADGAPGKIGIIAPVTMPFCGACSRLRLTADGNLRTLPVLDGGSQHSRLTSTRRNTQSDCTVYDLQRSQKESGPRFGWRLPTGLADLCHGAAAASAYEL